MLEVAGAAFPIAPLLSQCTKIVNILQDVSKRLRRTPVLLTSIATECSLIHVSLAQLRNLDWSSVASFAEQRQEQMTRATEAITLGCTLALSVIEEYSIELQEFVDELTPEASNRLDVKAQVQSLWKEDVMRELLLQLRAYQDGLINLLRAVHDESVGDLSNALGLHAFGDILRRSRISRSQKPLSLHAAMASSAAYSEYSQANASQTTTPSLSVRQSDPRSESSLGTTASSVSSIDRAVTPALDPASASATTFPCANVDYDDECNEPEQVHTHQRNLSLESNKQKKRPSRLNLRSQNHRKETLYDGMYLYTRSDKDQMRKSSPTVGDTFQFIPGLPPTAAQEQQYMESLAGKVRQESMALEDEFDNLDVMEEPEGYNLLTPMDQPETQLGPSQHTSATHTPTIAARSPPIINEPNATEDEEGFPIFPEDDSEFALAKPYFAPRKPRSPLGDRVRDQIMNLPESARLRKQAAGTLPDPPQEPEAAALPLLPSESIYDFHPQPLAERLPALTSSDFSSSTSTQKTLPEASSSQPTIPQHTEGSQRASFTPPSSPPRDPFHHSRSPGSGGSGNVDRPLIHHVSTQSLNGRSQPFANAFTMDQGAAGNVAPHPFAAPGGSRLYRSASDPRLLNFSTPNPMHVRQRSIDNPKNTRGAPRFAPETQARPSSRQESTDTWPLAAPRPHDFSIPQTGSAQLQQPALLEPQYSRSFTPSEMIPRGGRSNLAMGTDLYSEALQLRSRPTTLMTIASDAQGEMMDEAASVAGSAAPSTMSSQWYRNPQERLGLGPRIQRADLIPWDLNVNPINTAPSMQSSMSLPVSPVTTVFTEIPGTEQVLQSRQPSPENDLYRQATPISATPVSRSPVFSEDLGFNEPVQVSRQLSSRRPSLDVIPEDRSPPRVMRGPPESPIEIGEASVQQLKKQKARRFQTVREALAEYRRGNRDTISGPKPLSPTSPSFPDRPSTSLGMSAPTSPVFPSRGDFTAAGHVLAPSPLSPGNDLLRTRLVSTGVISSTASTPARPTFEVPQSATEPTFRGENIYPQDTSEFPPRSSSVPDAASGTHTRSRSHDAGMLLGQARTSTDTTTGGRSGSIEPKQRKSLELMGMNLARKLSSSSRRSYIGPTSGDAGPSSRPPGPMHVRSSSRLSFTREGAPNALIEAITTRGRMGNQEYEPKSPDLSGTGSRPGTAMGLNAALNMNREENRQHRRKLSAFPSLRELFSRSNAVPAAGSSRNIGRRSADELRGYPSSSQPGGAFGRNTDSEDTQRQ